MSDFHAEYGEIFLALLLVVGVVAASVFYLSAPKGDMQYSGDNGNASSMAPSDTANTSSLNLGNATIKENASAPLVTSKTTDDLLSEGLGRAIIRFNDVPNHIDYSSESFRWSIWGNQTPDSMPLRENDLRASLVRFNGRYIDSLRGFAFTVFSPPQTFIAPEWIKGTAVFLANDTDLDPWASGSTEFTMAYDPHPKRSQTLEKCRIVSAMGMVTMNGTAIKIYDIDCKLIYTTYP